MIEIDVIDVEEPILIDDSDNNFNNGDDGIEECFSKHIKKAV